MNRSLPTYIDGADLYEQAARDVGRRRVIGLGLPKPWDRAGTNPVPAIRFEL